ncbi:DUF397 domain-containing protein [Nocardia violaceofusca]|uniref:DUF397 domain-containing protein n=1 Tax=Nocardia violaceofusca TaxID=941182 RepID=UPI0012F523A0|nr:DUF397 domain-containing protein [Nocardia violaceofusca]
MTADLSLAKWFKSSWSGGSENCVEVAFLPSSAVAVRDSKEPAGPALVFDSAEWIPFVAAAVRGELDL